MAIGRRIGVCGGCRVSSVLIAYLRTVERHRIDRAEALRRSIMVQKLEVMGQMTASVAHDFRNILTVLKSAMHLLRKRGPNPAVFAEADATLDRGNAMVDRLLAFSKRHDLEVETVNVNILIASLERSLRHIGGTRLLVINLAEPLPSCRIDRVQFDAALTNLMVNAVQATPDGGLITIETMSGLKEVVVIMAEFGMRHRRCNDASHLRAVFHDQGWNRNRSGPRTGP